MAKEHKGLITASVYIKQSVSSVMISVSIKQFINPLLCFFKMFLYIPCLHEVCRKPFILVMKVLVIAEISRHEIPCYPLMPVFGVLYPVMELFQPVISHRLYIRPVLKTRSHGSLCSAHRRAIYGIRFPLRCPAG